MGEIFNFVSMTKLQRQTKDVVGSVREKPTVVSLDGKPNLLIIDIQGMDIDDLVLSVNERYWKKLTERRRTVIGDYEDHASVGRQLGVRDE